MCFIHYYFLLVGTNYSLLQSTNIYDFACLRYHLDKQINAQKDVTSVFHSKQCREESPVVSRARVTMALVSISSFVPSLTMELLTTSAKCLSGESKQAIITPIRFLISTLPQFLRSCHGRKVLPQEVVELLWSAFFYFLFKGRDLTSVMAFPLFCL
ncbi:hypothetical protein SAY87_031131 [Trapa incisa]|uniref:Uncharacterized protein n=1 Tax=Trapa incisa TaxID=236973 RepID=A0AAN7QKT5_9MYRT|nr:hypothetical protein SAY87_031131 [Trapa incisa]